MTIDCDSVLFMFLAEEFASLLYISSFIRDWPSTQRTGSTRVTHTQTLSWTIGDAGQWRLLPPFLCNGQFCGRRRVPPRTRDISPLPLPMSLNSSLHAAAAAVAAAIVAASILRRLRRGTTHSMKPPAIPSAPLQLYAAA